MDKRVARAFTVRAATPEETERWGERLGTLLLPGDIVLLEGLLGAGKTCLARGIARSLGVADPVTSPTFTLINEYEGTRAPVFHCDLYRLESEAELANLGLDEVFYDDGISIVEWPERLGPLFPREYILVGIEPADGGVTRLLCFGFAGSRAAEVIDKLRRFADGGTS